MANTIGSISIEMLADLASMVSDMGKAQQATRQFAEQSSASLKGLTRDFDEFKGSVSELGQKIVEIAGITVGLEAFKSMVEDVTKLDVGIKHLSDTLGISVGVYSDMHAAAALADTSLDEVTSTMTRLQRAASEAEGGNAKFVEGFHALGISASELKSLSPDQLLQRVAVAFTETAPSAERTANMVQLFGRNIAATYPILQQLAEGAHEAAVAFGDVIKPETTLKAEAFSQSLAHVKLAGDGLAQTFASQVLPGMAAIANQFAYAVSTSTGLRTAIADLGAGMEFAARHFDGLVESGKLLVELYLDVKIAAWSQALYGAAIQAQGTAYALASVGTAAVGAVGVGVAAFEGWKLGEWARQNFAWTAEIGQWLAAGIFSAKTVVVAGFQSIWIQVKADFQALIASIQTGLAAPFEYIAQHIAGPASIAFQNIANSIRPAVSATDLYTAGVKAAGDVTSSAGRVIGDIWRSISADSANAAKGVDDMNAFRDAVKAVNLEVAHGHISKEQAEADIEKLNSLADAAVAGGMSLKDVNAQLNQSYVLIGAASVKAGEGVSKFASGVKDTAEQLAKARLSWSAFIDQMESMGEGGELGKAVSQYSKLIDETLKHYQAFIDAGGDIEEANALLAKSFDDADAAMGRMDDTMQNELQDALDKIAAKYQEQIDGLKGVTQEQEIEKQYLQDLAAYQAVWTKVMGEGVPVTEEMKQHIHDLAAAHVEELDAAKKDSDALKQWQQIAATGFDSVGKSIADFATGGIKKWSDFGKALVGDAKQFIAQIIQEFLKLTIFNGIINSLFGLSGSSALPTMSAGSILGNIGGMFGGGGVGSFGGSDSIIGAVVQGSSGNGLLGNLFGSAGTGIQNFIGSADSNTGLMGWLFGSSVTSDVGALGDFTGPGTQFLNYGGEFNVTGAAAEGVDQSFNATAASQFGEGAGTSFLGTVGPMLGGFAAGYQLFGGGTTGIAAGIGLAAAAYFIPVVGWIAGALSLVNSLTGGGLFGTSLKPTGASTSTISVGPGGASVDDQIQESKKKALFGGTSTKWKDVSPSADQTQAVNDFFNQLQSSVNTFATALGQTAGQIIGGTFTTSIDKSGKTTTSDTVLGVTYTEDQQHFAERLQADSFLAVLDKMGIGASAFVAGMQGDADKLMAGVQDLANATAGAQADIKKGLSLLGDDTSVADVMNEVIKLNDGNEKLADEYVRLQQETVGFHAILDTMGQTIGKTGADFVEFADAASKAAGGIQNLTQLADQFAKDFYSSSELTANSIASLKTKVATEFAAIGEDPTESLAKFRQDFEAALPTMSPEDLAKWYQAGVDFATLNQEIGAAADSYTQFIDQFSAPTGFSQFEAAMDNLGESIVANIKKANDLAIANGLAGASAADIGKIITASVNEGVQLLQKLELEAGQLAGQLFGTGLDQLKQQLSDAQTRLDHAKQTGQYDIYDQALIKQLQGQISDQEAKDKAQQQFMQAATLLGDLGQIGAVTGQSLQDFAKEFNIPLDKLATMLGTDPAGLQKDFQTQEDMAKAALDTAGNTKYTNELLADILAQAQGIALPFSAQDLQDAFNNPTGKQSGHGYAPPGGGSAQPGYVATVPVRSSDIAAIAVPDRSSALTQAGASASGSAQAARRQEVHSDQIEQTNRILTEHSNLLRQALSRGWPTQRNTAGAMR